MRKQKVIAAAVLSAALAVAAAVPAWAAPDTEVEILQIDEPLNVESSVSRQTETEAAEEGTTATETSGIQAAETETEDASEQGNAELTTEQRSVILELVPDDLYRFYTSDLWDSVPETSVNIAALSAQDLVNEVYGVLRNANRNSAIFTPVQHEAQEGYSVWFDKDDALNKLASLYGRRVSESDINEYNNEWGGDMPDMIAIDKDAIASLNPEGEGTVFPSISSAVSDSDELKVTLTFNARFDDSKNNGSGRATAVFIQDPESFIGYRLKSIALD